MYTFILTGRESVISAKIYPSIILDSNKTYALGLIDFVTFNTIPNVDETNNKFYIGSEVITVPEGTYEIGDIENYIKSKIMEKQNQLKEKKRAIATVKQLQSNTIQKEVEDPDEVNIFMKTNHNTLRFEIKSNKKIHFDKENSIASLLGFNKQKLSANKLHISDFPINISKVNSICIECNLITNSYSNERSVHILHMFYPNVPSGFRIIEKVSNVIYLPINSNYIDEITVKIVDQDGNCVNFKGEIITVRLHLKEV